MGIPGAARGWRWATAVETSCPLQGLLNELIHWVKECGLYSGTKGRSDVFKQGTELNSAKTFLPVEWIRDAMARSLDNSAGTWGRLVRCPGHKNVRRCSLSGSCKCQYWKTYSSYKQGHKQSWGNPGGRGWGMLFSLGWVWSESPCGWHLAPSCTLLEPCCRSLELSEPQSL